MSILLSLYEIVMMYLIVRFVLNRTISHFVLMMGTVLVCDGYVVAHDVISHPAIWFVVIIGLFGLCVNEKSIINRIGISTVACLILGNYDLFMAAFEAAFNNIGIHERMYADIDGYYAWRIAVLATICILIYFVRKKNGRSIMPDKYALWAVVKAVFFFVIMPVTDMVDVYEKKGLQYLTVLSFVIFALVVDCFIIMFYYLMEVRDELKESNLAKDYYIEAVNDYYEKNIEDAKEVRRVRHDIKAHINAVRYYAKSGDCKSIKTYTDKLLDELEGEHSNIVVSGLSFLDAIIAKFIDTYSDVDFTVFGTIKNTKMSDYDISIVLTNLLNNAVEACEKYKGKKYVEINLANPGDKCVIKIANPIDESFSGIEKTSKADSDSHGYGLGQVKRIVERNGGRLDINIGEDAIECSVII
ncbi:MAG: GHKL domain-containing protein [Eubacterium sp.]|nr:GHKL domain-containing protein [Eubacterium sp.]